MIILIQNIIDYIILSCYYIYNSKSQSIDEMLSVIEAYKTEQKIKHIMNHQAFSVYDIPKYLGFTTLQRICH